MKGKVYLIGAGPGRPDLITVRGLNILKQAEVVIYDYLVDPKVLKVVPPGAELIGSDELGKHRYKDTFTLAQEAINRLMVKKALQGKKVVRLKNGEPSIFGRLSQEMEALLAHKIDFEIVPGVTAGSAAAAYTGIPLTDRRFSSTVIFVTGHEDPTKGESRIDWQSLAAQKSIVLYMAVENLSKIVKILLEFGKAKNTPAAVISEAGSLRQKSVIGSLQNIAERVKKAKISPPAIVIFGEAVKLESKYNWFKKSKRILFTGLSEERFFLKGTYFHLPMIEIKPLENYREFDSHIEKIGENKFDWLIFASRYGVEYFFKRFKGDARQLGGLKIGAVGNSTAHKLLEYGIKADFVPKVESSTGLLKEIKRSKLAGKRIFMPRSDLADKGLAAGLEKLGAKATSVVAYRNIMPDNLPDIDLSFFDEIVFTSPSTVRNFKKRYGKVPKGIKVRWIGEVTKAELDIQSLLIKHS